MSSGQANLGYYRQWNEPWASYIHIPCHSADFEGLLMPYALTTSWRKRSVKEARVTRSYVLTGNDVTGYSCHPVHMNSTYILDHALSLNIRFHQLKASSKSLSTRNMIIVSIATTDHILKRLVVGQIIVTKKSTTTQCHYQDIWCETRLLPPFFS